AHFVVVAAGVGDDDVGAIVAATQKYQQETRRSGGSGEQPSADRQCRRGERHCLQEVASSHGRSPRSPTVSSSQGFRPLVRIIHMRRFTPAQPRSKKGLSGAAVKPSMAAAGKTSCFSRPRKAPFSLASAYLFAIS